MNQVENAADVGMGDAAGELDLPLEALQHALVAGDLRTQDLDGDGVAELLIERLVNLADRTPAEEGGDPVAAGQRFARRQGSAPRPVQGIARDNCH